ncbi:MAG: dihydrolipoyllysine-residue acetyltransferase [Gammaproteobacteria bacterium]|nr:dihydrolipoyllysine-residue acetyltransferase [Gammaproteobacteria bacterium]
MSTAKQVLLPDIGDFEDVDVIEILVSPGDEVKLEDSLVTLESDKATMEIPSPYAGVVKSIVVTTGDKVSKGSPLLTMDVAEPLETPADADADDAATPEPPPPAPPVVAPAPQTPPLPGSPPPAKAPVPQLTRAEVADAARRAHASPTVRRLARELAVDLGQVEGSGPKGRILKEDIQAFVKKVMSRSAATAAVGVAVAEAPKVDFSRFGDVEVQALSRVKKRSGANLHRNWVTIPHVTQFDEADITELETFRKNQVEKLTKEGVKLTMLAFLIKASVVALKEYPEFNASLDDGGENLLVKRYYNIGIAVDTPDGLVVPVIRQADQKGLFRLAAELHDVSEKARSKKLSPEDMQGGSFSISSLGGIGGTAFTPIVNAPEVAILGIAKANTKPVFRDNEFVPRLILPLALSYDHRVIDGAAAARFTTTLRTVLSDIRHMLL